MEFNLRGVPETLASLQDLWRYATSDWLSLRTPTPNRQRTRWPLDLVWEEVQAVEIVPSSTGAVRQRLHQASLQRIVLGLWGYLTALGALRERPELEAAIAELRRQLERHMDEKDRSFPAEVARKRARYLGVTAFLDEEPEDDRGAA